MVSYQSSLYRLRCLSFCCCCWRYSGTLSINVVAMLKWKDLVTASQSSSLEHQIIQGSWSFLQGKVHTTWRLSSKLLSLIFLRFSWRVILDWNILLFSELSSPGSYGSFGRELASWKIWKQFWCSAIKSDLLKIRWFGEINSQVQQFSNFYKYRRWQIPDVDY